MGLVDRHKKPGGFRKLVNSLEITSPEKRIKIIDALRAEDPGFVTDVEKDILNFEELAELPDMMISELVSSLRNMQNLAIALYKMPLDFTAKFTKNMTHVQTRSFNEETLIADQITAAQRMGSQFKIIEVARMLQSEGKLKLKPYNLKYLD